MPGLCFCCLSEEDKVHIVMSDIGSIQKLADIAKDGGVTGFPQLLCGRIRPLMTVLQAPISGKPCVFYEAIAEKMVDKTDDNAEVGEEDEESHGKIWVQIYRETKASDFCLVDPQTPDIAIMVPGASVPVNILANEDTKKSHKANKLKENLVKHNNKKKVPAYTAEFLKRGHINLKIDEEVQKIRFRESCFEYGEQLAALGVVTIKSADADSELPLYVMQPVSRASLTDEYMNSQYHADGLTRWERQSWLDLTENPSIVLTDKEQYFRGVKIEPLKDVKSYDQINSELVASRGPSVMVLAQPLEDDPIEAETMSR